MKNILSENNVLSKWIFKNCGFSDRVEDRFECFCRVKKSQNSEKFQNNGKFQNNTVNDVKQVLCKGVWDKYCFYCSV